MQIYNYAEYQPKRRILPSVSMPLSFKRAGGKDYTTKTRSKVTKFTKTERVLKFNRVFSLKSFVIRVGAGLTDTENLLKSHIKLVIISILVLAAAGSASWGLISYTTWNERHANPLVLQADPETEIARLDKMMADFALENYGDIKENGDISDSAINLNAVFTQPVTYQNYKVQKGDTISGIAKKFGLTNISTLIAVNDIGNVRSLSAGQKLKIPSIDGITYKVQQGDSLASIATKNKISQDSILDVNDLESDILQAGQVIFLPGAKMDQKALSLAMGDQFIHPIKAAYRMSSAFGSRLDPITGKKSYHKGQDFACPTGTPIYSSMGGKVIFSGESWLYGKHIIIDHGNGYQTLYAHMSKIIAQKGTYVTQGTRIGLVGNTGYSTGPHLHFTVYKNGNPINPMTVLK